MAIFPPKFVKKPIAVVTDAETHGWSQIKWVFINSPITRFLCDKTLSQKMIALEPVTLLEAFVEIPTSKLSEIKKVPNKKGAKLK